MDNPDTHPFSLLTPDFVLDALDSIGIRGDGRLLALNSYENRVYQVGIEESAPLVVKFYRPNRWSDDAILEEHAFVQELHESEIPAVAPMSISGSTLHWFGEFRFAAFPMRGGRTPELEDPETLEWIGRFMGRIHAIGSYTPYRIRPEISIESFGRKPRDYLLSRDFVPPGLLAAYSSVTAQALGGIQRCFDRAGQIKCLRLHGDCHAGNMLWTDNGPHFVDFDDSRMGPAIQDLWMMLSGERVDMTRQLSDILAGYEQFFEFDRRQLHLIESLRTLRMIHYSAWLAQRWEDPAFPAAFPWFGSERYWQDRILELREQIALMDEPPLVV